MKTQFAQSAPWYREPWPWLLMAGPATVVVAGAITIYLAVVSSDGLVADDYYKRGLAINQTLSRDALAKERDYHARVEFTADFAQVNVSFERGAPDTTQLVLHLAHPGRAALDRMLPLRAQGDGRYAGVLPELTAGRWQLTLEDAGRTWRLVGDMIVPGRASVSLSPRKIRSTP